MEAPGVVYRPSAWGSTYHQLNIWELLGAGAQGPGKSTCLLADPFKQIRVEDERCQNKKHPYHLPWGESVGWALLLRRTRPMLTKLIAVSKVWFPKIEPTVKWDDEQTTWTFRSGFKFQFGHCKDPDSYQIYDSNEYTWIGFDELTQFLEEQYERIILRCRTSDPVLGAKDSDGRYEYLRIRSMSNPLIRMGNSEEGSFIVRDPHWVRRRFVDPHKEGRVIFRRKIKIDERYDENGALVADYEYRERMYLPATIDDNPNKDFVRHQKATLMDARPHIRQAMLYGDWYVSPASYYADEWDKRLHIVKAFRIPPNWKRFRSMDWGYKVKGIIGWWALDEEENLYLTEEYVFKGKTVEEVASRIKELETRMGLWDDKKSRITGPADNQIFRESGMGETIASRFAKLGVPWENAVQGQGTRYNQALMLSERLMDHDHGTAQPGIVFFEHCELTTSTIPSIQVDPHDSEVPMEGGEDHAFDMTRYACAYVSHGVRKIRPRKRKTSRSGPAFDDDLKEERFESRKSANHYLDD